MDDRPVPLRPPSSISYTLSLASVPGPPWPPFLYSRQPVPGSSTPLDIYLPLPDLRRARFHLPQGASGTCHIGHAYQYLVCTARVILCNAVLIREIIYPGTVVSGPITHHVFPVLRGTQQVLNKYLPLIFMIAMIFVIPVLFMMLLL